MQQIGPVREAAEIFERRRTRRRSPGEARHADHLAPERLGRVGPLGLLGQVAAVPVEPVRGRAVAVEVNKKIVPRKTHDQARLTDGDVVEVVTLVGGG